MKRVKKISRTAELLFFISAILFAIQCSQPEIPKKEVAHLYVDLLVAEQSFHRGIDSLDIIRDSLFRKYGISEKKYKAKLWDYAQDSDEWKEFYEYSMSYLDSLRLKYEN